MWKFSLDPHHDIQNCLWYLQQDPRLPQVMIQKCAFNEILFMMNVEHSAIADVRTERTFSTVSRLSRMKNTLNLSHVWRKSVDIQHLILMKMWSLWTRKVSLHRIYLLFKFYTDWNCNLIILVLNLEYKMFVPSQHYFFPFLDLVSTLWVMCV